MLRDKAPEQVAALEQLVADVHRMVAHLQKCPECQPEEIRKSPAGVVRACQATEILLKGGGCGTSVRIHGCRALPLWT